MRVVSPAQLDDADRARLAAISQANRPNTPPPDLGHYVRQRWMVMRNHRNSGIDPLNERLLRGQRAFDGRYDPDKLAEIAKFGGSKVYARVTAGRCRSASALLRDVYLGPDRPWSIDPQPDPPVPPEVRASIMQLLGAEVEGLKQSGAPVLQDQIHLRFLSLMHAAQQAARRAAQAQAKSAADKIQDILKDGRFYQAMREFIVDLPMFPFACLKGPVVRMVPRLTWLNGQPSMKTRPQMFWERVSPFNIFWTPGASAIEESEIIERKRLTRADLNDLIGLKGYDQKAVRAALIDYGSGLRDWLDATDTEQALNEHRENPNMNQSQMIDALEYHGNVQGKVLLEQGVSAKLVPDPDRDYAVQTWIVGRHTIKTQLNPSPRQRHPYFVTSYEKVPGTIAGNGLPDILEDLQDTENATQRALVNNMSIASGPQVVINDDAIAGSGNNEDMYPWKRWHVVNDPSATNREPITFFQPHSNAQELLAVSMATLARADDASAIPRYMAGSGQAGGAAGRTSSGLAMLMGNSSKILQNVAANVDGDVVEGVLAGLYDMIMLTDQSGMLTGEETVEVRGVNVAIQQETERAKQLQFLQVTANPIDAPIVGKLGRARVLRAVVQGLGLPDDVIPDDDTIQREIAAETRAAAIQAATMPPSPGDPKKGPPPAPGHPGPGGIPVPTPPPSAEPTPASQAQGTQSPAVPPARMADHAPPFNAFQQGVPTHG